MGDLPERLLVANRSEIAVRVIRACRELGVSPIAVYSDADEHALHVRLADEAVHIGGSAAPKSYLNIDHLIEAAQKSGAQAVHPGYGFLAESAGFAKAVEDAGLVFVGPPSDVVERLGDKVAARQLAAEAGVPVVPGTGGAGEVDELLAAADDVGYPVLLKAAAGGGGRGIRVAEDADQLREVFRGATREAEKAFGSGAMYLEKLLDRPRHVEVQVLADHHGSVVHLYERECSIQRRRQKLLEESPSPRLSDTDREAMCAAAVRLTEAAGYTNAGTVEFLVAGSAGSARDDNKQDGDFFFIEMNTRIQVEHPVTELRTGVDLVAEQIRIAAGQPLTFAQDDVVARGAAIEFRINAEDPDNDFAPSPGELTEVEVPGGPGVRVDSAMTAGGSVAPFYDSLIGKLSVWAPDRERALARGRRALAEFRIEGLPTTIPLHLRLLGEQAVIDGDYDITYLEALLVEARASRSGKET